MFLATVILLLSCIENTSSSSTVQICSFFSSIKHAHDGSVARTDYKLVQFQLQQLYQYGEIVQLQSALNDDYSNVQEKSNMYHISEPIIRRFFFQNVCYFVHFRAVFIDSFSFAMKRCNTSQGFGAFFVQSCDRFLFRLNFFSPFSRSFCFFFFK